jgi:hypothetical protein
VRPVFEFGSAKVDRLSAADIVAGMLLRIRIKYRLREARILLRTGLSIRYLRCALSSKLVEKVRELCIVAIYSASPLASLGLWSHAARATALVLLKPPDWQALGRQLGGRLIEVHSSLTACADAGGVCAEALFAQIKNLYFLSDEPGLTQTLGWTDAWTFHDPSERQTRAELSQY